MPAENPNTEAEENTTENSAENTEPQKATENKATEEKTVEPTPTPIQAPPSLGLISEFNQFRERLGQGAMHAATSINDRIKSILRIDEPEDPDPTSALTMPIYATGDIIDGTALNISRRAQAIAESAGPDVRASYRTLTRPIFHPIDTISHPVKYLANPARILTSKGKITRELIKTPFKFFGDLYKRGISRPAKRLTNLPLVGGLFGLIGKGKDLGVNAVTKTANLIGKVPIVGTGLSWIKSKLISAVKGSSSMLDKADNFVASHQ